MKPKRISIFLTIFFFLISGACTNTVTPNITSITYAGGVVTILIADTNQAPKEHVSSNTTLHEGSFTGTGISFDISAVPASPFASKEYQLNSFSPPLQSGLSYYLSFQAGAFNNTPNFLGDGRSASGAFTFQVP